MEAGSQANSVLTHLTHHHYHHHLPHELSLKDCMKDDGAAKARSTRPRNAATGKFACGMLQGRGLEGSGLGLAELNADRGWCNHLLRSVVAAASLSRCPSDKLRVLVALYRVMQLRFGYGFESCEANGPRNIKSTNIAKDRPIFFPHSSLVVRNWS